MSRLIDIITSDDPAVRNTPLDTICRAASYEELLSGCRELDSFRRRSDNLYGRVRALFFLYAIHSFHLTRHGRTRTRSIIPFQGYVALLHRRFEEAIEIFLAAQQT